MPNFAIIVGGFVLGLAGSLHCVGMCGPIAISLPLGSAHTSDRVNAMPLHLIAQRLLYQSGRVITYTILGAIVGFGGSMIRLGGLSQTLSISAGVLMLAVASSQLLAHRKQKLETTNSILQKLTSNVQQWMRSLFVRHGAFAHLGIGLANGLLPCGLVTMALFAALGSNSVASSAIFMASFGLGTVPLMSAIAIFGLAIPCEWRARVRLAAPIFAVALGLLIIVRGLGLGIPYVSPTAAIAHPISCCTR